MLHACRDCVLWLMLRSMFRPRWSPRVKKSQLYRLYKSEAMGQLDCALLEEVGCCLLARCRDILAVGQAVDGRAACLECRARGVESIIERPSQGPKTLMVCPACSWRTTWGEYRKTFQRKQLNTGGAGPAFRAFVDGWPAAASVRQKMLLVDRLIHEYHFSLKTDPMLPTRAAAVNLIDGKLADVVAFLDELAEGIDDPELTETYENWTTSRRRVEEW